MKKRIVFKIIVIILLSLHVFSCERIFIYGDIVEDPSLAKNLYNSSQDTLLIGSNRYILEIELSRNFFPSFGPTNKKLFAYMYVVNIDSLPVPNTIDINRLYVIKNQQIWISYPLKHDQSFVPDFKIYRISKNGPKWDTGTFVDVVIEIEDKSTKYGYGLIAKDQCICRIE